MTVEAVAKEIERSKQTALYYIKNGYIRGFKYNRRWYVKPEDLVEYAQKNGLRLKTLTVCDNEHPVFKLSKPIKPYLKRNKYRNVATNVFKTNMFAEGIAECEVCGFNPPSKFARRLLEVHHIVPVSCGGTDMPENLVLICANCHRLSHSLFKSHYKLYFGPRSKQEFIYAITNPEKWEYDLLKEAMIIKRTPLLKTAINKEFARSTKSTL